MRNLRAILYLFCPSLLLLISANPVFARERVGVDVPYPINVQKFEITNGQFITYAYKVLLNREPDNVGPANLMKVLEDGSYTRQGVFANLMNSTEFKGNPALTDNTEYAKRLYKYIFHREATSAELQTQVQYIQDSLANGLSLSDTWINLLSGFINNPENKVNCTTSAYSYETPLKQNAPSLADLFDKKAHFQPPTEAKKISVMMSGVPVSLGMEWRLPIIQTGNSYLGFARHIVNDNNGKFLKWDISAMTSSDGINFSEPQRIFGDRTANSTYDPSVSIDYSYCPKRYILTMECDPGGVCTSESSNPENKWSWSLPQNRVSPAFINGIESASTGVTAVDSNGNRYVYWTDLENSGFPNQSSTNARGFSKGALLNSNDPPITAQDGVTVMDAVKEIFCTSGWDCNYKDKHDIKYEDGYYYLTYNGANYFGCFPIEGRPEDPILWAIGLSRSRDPLGNFDNDRTGKVIDTEVRDICGTMYPMVNNIGGELNLYYVYVPVNHDRLLLQSRLIWNGDINADSHVDAADYNLLVNNFATHPYTIFDYNQLVENFGK